ncbi:hypothetical protein HHK36_016720 [Tetracentron sinense]|uniref:Homeobox-leucine zipper protein n=1 Tax=Tetracentron sinense TaxID=13715 RepID=A0A834Z0Z2_TETSI|nr:hypothetical protein HHK36_016720 [Tetracentron sinense]
MTTMINTQVGVELKCRSTEPVGQAINKSNGDRKKRLTYDQAELLERSFQDEIKLEPERKLRLATELGLPPRQVAVWFQNRRARWKAKQLELLYDELKREFHVISREKQKLHEEVMKLKAELDEREAKNQIISAGFAEFSGGEAKNQIISTGFAEFSGEETVESTPVVVCSSNKSQGTNYNQIAECNYLFNLDDYNPALLLPYWGALPTYS